MKSGFTTALHVKVHAVPLKERPFEVLETFSYIRKSGLEITVEVGYRTDFASIPRFFHRVYNPVGTHGPAAVVHDWLCDESPKTMSHIEAADVFNEAMTHSGVNSFKRWVLTRAVKLGGPKFNKGDN